MAIGSAPHSTIVKLWDTESPAGRREIDFYTNFADLLKAWIPTCYYGEVDIKTGQGVLIFKDLTPVAQGDCLLQLPLPLAIKTAHNLAGIHASWQDHESLERAEWLPNVSVWARTADWFDPRRSLFLERFGDRLDRNAIRLLDRIELAQVTANQRLANAPVTLLHGDLHLDNYIFVDGTYPVLLDWARCAQGSLSLDLYDLLFSIVKERDRDRIFETYLEAFEKHASQGLDQAEVWNQLGGTFLRKFALNICGVANWQPASPREWAMINTELERTFSALSYWLKQDPELFTFLE